MTCGPRRPSRPNRSGPRWLHLGIDASGEGGYARELTAEECEQQQAALTEPTKGCDVADFEELVARGERPDNLDARPNLDRPRFDDDPKVLEHRFFGALEINAARVIDELVTSRPPVELADHARANGFRPGQLLKGKRAVRFAQFPAAQAVRSPDWRKEANAHTAAAVAAEIETKVRIDLEAATDPKENTSYRNGRPRGW